MKELIDRRVPSKEALFDLSLTTGSERRVEPSA
jgi:hypothetical protein